MVQERVSTSIENFWNTQLFSQIKKKKKKTHIKIGILTTVRLTQKQ